MSSNYREIIQFNNQVGGVKVKQKGVKVSDDLCVASASPYQNPNQCRWMIFSIISGRPIVKLYFEDVEKAIDVAEILDEIYKEFWFLLSEYPRMNIPQICMWTVPNGIQIYIALNILETNVRLTANGIRDTITLDDLKRAYEAAKNEVSDYVKFPQKNKT